MMNYGLQPTDRAELTVNRKLVNRAPKLPHEGATATYNGITIVFRAGAWRDDRPVAQRVAGLPDCTPRRDTALNAIVLGGKDRGEERKTA